MGYSLDGQDNVTLTETTLNITKLVNGSYNLTVYATDTDGNTSPLEPISFTVAKAEPPITNDDEISATWTKAAIMVSAAIVAVALYFTKMRKTAHKNASILGS